MTGKRAITPVIAVILLIVMTVGIAALTFVWMQNFIRNLQIQTQQQASQLQKAQFALSSPTGSQGESNITVVISNIGTVPINLSKMAFTVEKYYLVNNTYVGTVGNVVGKTGVCSGILNPNQQTTCTITLSGTSLDFTQYSYVITASYNGVSAQYTLRK